MSVETVKIGGVTVPAGLEKKALLRFLVENKANLISEKRATIKEADALPIAVDLRSRYSVDTEGKLVKAALNQPMPAESDTVLVVINTTNLLDSHQDVHIPGLWNKSLKDNGNTFLHLQEHKLAFTNIISDDAKGYVQNMAWKELGYDAPGSTEALVFESKLTGRNVYMDGLYRKGQVKNHSVGMRYVRIKLCVNDSEDEYYKEEYANWVQYSPMVVNLPAAEELGFFWAVLEAQIIEGSAVPKGSNHITPSIGYKSVEPPVGTQPGQPSGDTGSKESKGIDWDKVSKAFI